MVPSRKRKEPRSRLCGGPEGEARWLRCHSFWLGFGPGPGSSVGRALAASAGAPGSIPGWDVLAFFPFSLMTLYHFFNIYICIYIYIYTCIQYSTVSAFVASSVQYRLDQGQADQTIQSLHGVAHACGLHKT